MGFDVYGLNAKNETGEYFRNNVWWWRRLWDFCCQITPELTDEDHRSGHYNDGHTIDGIKHKALKENLLKALSETARYSGWVQESEVIYLKDQQMIALQIRGEEARQDKDFNTCNHPFSSWRCHSNRPKTKGQRQIKA